MSRGSTSFAFDWHMAAGFLQQVSWDHSRAFDRYTAALELRPGHPEALLARATALEFSAIRDGFGGALVGGRNMWRFLGTGTSPSLADSGSQDPQRRRLLEVLTVHYRELVRLDRGQAEVRLRLGRVLEERGRHEEAAAELRPAATATDDPFVAAVARLCLARGERTPEAAAVAYRSALDVDSSLSQAWLGLSDALRTGGDREGALAALERGLAPEKPRTLDAWVLYHLGRGRAFPSALARLRTRLTRPN